MANTTRNTPLAIFQLYKRLMDEGRFVVTKDHTVHDTLRNLYLKNLVSYRESPIRVHTLAAYKISYMHYFGMPEEGQVIAVKDGNRQNIRPENLFILPEQYTTRAHSEKHPQARFTTKEVIHMRDLFASGKYTIPEIAEMYKDHAQLASVRKIINGEFYKDVPMPNMKNVRRSKSKCLPSDVIYYRKLSNDGREFAIQEFCKNKGIAVRTAIAIIDGYSWKHLPFKSELVDIPYTELNNIKALK